MRSRAVLAVAVLSGALVSGGWLMQMGFSGRAPHVYERARLFDEVMEHVARNYVDRMPREELYERATRGVLRELHDPYSAFLTSERLARLTESTTGRYHGIGVELDVRDGWVTVVTPLPGTPAEQAGVQTGDRIVAIDGAPTRGWEPEEALRALRGAAGSAVDVVVERDGIAEPVPFRLTRREIRFHPVQQALMLRDGVGYVSLVAFSEESAAALRQAVDSLRRVGARSLVIDVRGNPGGLLEQGVAVTDLFLDEGLKILEMRGRTRDASRTFVDRAPQPYPELPVAVLVDSTSASAAEIFAGALQDQDRAVLVGSATYGKGSAQSVFQLEGGRALKLTTALWYTPVGRSINRPLTAAAADSEPDEAADTVRETFRTIGGRVVQGGGGIVPDLIVPRAVATPEDIAFQQALGTRVPEFRDAVNEYVRTLRGSIRSADFVVTPEMRAALYQRMQRRGVDVDRAVFDAASSLVDRVLGVEIARYVLGGDAEFRRSVREDATIQAALDLMASSESQAGLLERADARQAEQRASAPSPGS